MTHPIAFDATPVQMKQRIESSLKLAGTVQVSRSSPDDQGGFRWNVTFVSAPGNVEQLVPHSQLTGRQVGLRVDTRREGNDIGGFFTVSFEGGETGLIPANASAQELQDILERDLPAVATAHVSRNDPTGLCEHGLCSNGPLPAWGYRYTVTLATDEHNQAPTSPTSVEFITPLPAYPATVTSYLTGVGANISIVLEHDTTQPTGMPPHPLVASSPFSLAYGGAGGSFGGREAWAMHAMALRSRTCLPACRTSLGAAAVALVARSRSRRSPHQILRGEAVTAAERSSWWRSTTLSSASMAALM